MKSRLRRILTGIFVSCLALLALELVLRGLAALSPGINLIVTPPGQQIPRTVPDARLGYRPYPGYPGHDQFGFRNRTVPAQARVVALGDSQTYGTSVSLDEAWPKQLELLAGSPVYNMAFGGYGPVHSLMLWDDVKLLRPATVIEAFYPGNDLHDAFVAVYDRGAWDDLESPDRKVVRTIRSLEAVEPLARSVSRLFRKGWGDIVSDAPEPSPRHFLAEHSRLCHLLVRAWDELVRGAAPRGDLSRRSCAKPDVEVAWKDGQDLARAHPEYYEAFSNAQARTVFTPRFRLAALDLREPRIREGLRISLEAMRRMHGRAAWEGIRFVVLLIPTKELVFRDVVERPSAEYRAVVANEEAVRKQTMDYLRKHRIEYVDALPALRRELASGKQPYPVSRDGHPNAWGHAVLAAAVHAQLAGSP
ncbi:MAG: hypothetical protein V1873_02885 [Verrucomicrobiota bacterium]